MILIIISLVVAALYCGGSWLSWFYRAYTGKVVVDAEIAEHTFHLRLLLK